MVMAGMDSVKMDLQRSFDVTRIVGNNFVVVLGKKLDMCTI